MKKILLASATSAAILAGMTPIAAQAQSGAPATVQTFHGNIAPFHGNISPFYGNISPFHGNISPFYGNIAPFWGNISPFHGNIAPFWGNISPFHGNISPFWGNIAPFWGNISPFASEMQSAWGQLPTTGAAGQVAVRDQMRTFISRSEDFWGASVQAQTGQNFTDAFASKVLSKYGIDLNRPETLANVSAENRARFMFDWYDGLMQFSGRDQADHWMATARWNPAITQQQGMGTGVVIGLVDVAIGSDADLRDNVIRWEGNSAAINGHGGAVASLMVAAHDNKGVMGIAPNASVALFNPFDASGTTNWQSVARGVVSVTNAGASVVNLSLGIPGWVVHPDFRHVYTNPIVAPALGKTLFVQAAGNEGVTQTSNVEWDFNDYPHLILVGSVGPDGTISNFSNRPGNACFTRQDKNKCKEYLNDRFIVAPGEWILVSDGQGGVTRASGTSFAAPLVTGAAALLHDRWPWLRTEPKATANIILNSAQDLGAPGTDGVYGRGLLDITASQSPLDFENLYALVAKNKDKMQRVSINDVREADDDDNARRVWDTQTHVVVYEDINNTFRDFLIPLTDGLTTASVNGRVETMQYFLREAFKKWMDSESDFTQQIDFAHPGGVDFSVKMGERNEETRDGAMPYAFNLTAETATGATFHVGHGQGAMALHTGGAIGAASTELSTGGVDPLFGLAAGGAYLGARQTLREGLSLAVSASTRTSEAFVTAPVSGEQADLNPAVDPYKAQAAKIELRQQVSVDVALSMAYSFLNERAAVLGVQSVRPTDFAQGAQTDAMTLGAEWTPSAKVSVAASATLGKTRAQNSGDQMLSVGGEGLTTSAFEAALTVNGVAGKSDRARVRIAQPLQLEKGHFDMTSVEVVNRMTGELGVVTRQVELNGGDRSVLLEGMYAAPFMNGMGEFAAFARVDAANGFDAPGSDNVVGASFKLRF